MAIDKQLTATRSTSPVASEDGVRPPIHKPTARRFRFADCQPFIDPAHGASSPPAAFSATHPPAALKVIPVDIPDAQVVQSSDDQGSRLCPRDPMLSNLGKPTTNAAARAVEAEVRGLAVAHTATSVPMDRFFSGMDGVLLTRIIGLSPDLVLPLLNMQDEETIDRIIAGIQRDDLVRNVHSAVTAKLLLRASKTAFLKIWSGFEQTDKLKLMAGLTDDTTLATFVGRLIEKK
jgi:hypothetical protein